MLQQGQVDAISTDDTILHGWPPRIRESRCSTSRWATSRTGWRSPSPTRLHPLRERGAGQGAGRRHLGRPLPSGPRLRAAPPGPGPAHPDRTRVTVVGLTRPPPQSTPDGHGHRRCGSAGDDLFDLDNKNPTRTILATTPLTGVTAAAGTGAGVHPAGVGALRRGAGRRRSGGRDRGTVAIRCLPSWTRWPRSCRGRSVGARRRRGAGPTRHRRPAPLVPPAPLDVVVDLAVVDCCPRRPTWSAR